MAGSDKDKNPDDQEGKDCKGVQVGKTSVARPVLPQPAASKSQKRLQHICAPFLTQHCDSPGYSRH